MNFKYPLIHSDAMISNGRLHRYSLCRIWDDYKPMVMFIGLNPSRADNKLNDATIIRCINYAQNWTHFGLPETVFGGMYFANLYSFRTPYVHDVPPEEASEWESLIQNLHRAHNEETDQYLKKMIKNSRTVVCCWGSWKFTDARAKEVLAMIEEPMCFGTNANGSPKHPLYLPKTCPLFAFP